MELRDGTIISLEVKNFLCHKRLKVNFEKSIKFIVGHNGSGKSSILDAVILGLGGKASNTHRYANIKDYVLTGAGFASIEIKLRNSGPNAYKPTEYGHHITVAREILPTGTSTYKIKSDKDEVKATTHATLEAILLSHNIQINNPMSVLPQKLCKQFMDSKKTTEKFDFFNRATNLDQTEEKYETALDKCDVANKIWEDKKKECDELEKEFKKWKQVMENFESRDRNRNEKKDLEVELQWSEVAEKTHILEEEKRKCQLLDAELQKHQEDLARLNNDPTNEDAITNMKNNKAKEMENKEKLKSERTKLQDTLTKLKLDLSNASNKKCNITTIVEREMRKVGEFQRQIQEITSDGAEGRGAALAAEAAAARAAEAETDARRRTADDHLQRAHLALEHARDAHRRADDHLRERRRLHDSLRREAEALQRESGSLAAYGECAARLAGRVRALAAAGGFRQPPRGPIGSYLTVEDETWSSVLEQILGSSMKSYCVDNSEDCNKLFALIDEVYANSREGRPSVSCSEFVPRAHDTRAREAAAPHALCALRALRVRGADPVVHNYLVDELALEGVLLVRDDEHAMRLCRAAPPPHCRRVLTADCAEYTPAPRYRCYGGARAPPRLLHASAEHALRELRARAAAADADARAASDARDAAAGALAEAAARREAAAAAQRELGAALERRRAAARRCEEALARHREPQLDQLQTELALSEETIKSKTEERDAVDVEQRETSAEIENMSRQLADLNTQLQITSENIEKIEREIEEKEAEFNNSRSTVNNKKRKIEEIKERIRSIEMNVEEQETKIRRLKSKINGPTIENPRDRDELLRLLQQKEAEISSYSSEWSREHAQRRLHDARAEYTDVREKLHSLYLIIQDLKNTVIKHRKVFFAQQKTLILHVQNRITKILDMWKIKAGVRISLGARTLCVEAAGRLSGGETTCATLALLLAMQDCADLPFFFMDEFDVYLDDKNQEKVLELLLEAARRKPTCQYVFITPNPPDLRAAHDLDIQTLDVIPQASTSY